LHVVCLISLDFF